MFHFSFSHMIGAGTTGKVESNQAVAGAEVRLLKNQNRWVWRASLSSEVKCCGEESSEGYIEEFWPANKSDSNYPMWN